MLRNSLIALSIASLSAFSPLSAEEKTKGTYLVGSVGSGVMNDIDFVGGGTVKFDPGFSGEIGLGYDFGSVRTELTYSSLTTTPEDASEIDVEVNSFLISAAYDWRADKKWQPYVALGIGSSTVDVSAAATVGAAAFTVGDENIATAKFRLGLSYEASENMDMYAETWGQSFDDFTIGALEFRDITTSGVSLGIRIKL